MLINKPFDLISLVVRIEEDCTDEVKNKQIEEAFSRFEKIKSRFPEVNVQLQII